MAPVGFFKLFLEARHLLLRTQPVGRCRCSLGADGICSSEGAVRVLIHRALGAVARDLGIDRRDGSGDASRDGTS